MSACASYTRSVVLELHELPSPCYIQPKQDVRVHHTTFYEGEGIRDANCVVRVRNCYHTQEG